MIIQMVLFALFAVLLLFHIGAIYALPGKTLDWTKSACVSDLTFFMSVWTYVFSLKYHLFQFDNPSIHAAMKEVNISSIIHPSILFLSCPSIPQVQKAVVQQHPSLQPHCDNVPPHKSHSTLLLANVQVGCTKSWAAPYVFSASCVKNNFSISFFTIFL